MLERLPGMQLFELLVRLRACGFSTALLLLCSSKSAAAAALLFVAQCIPTPSSQTLLLPASFFTLAASVKVSMSGRLLGAPDPPPEPPEPEPALEPEPEHQARQLVVLELVVCFNMVFYRARLLVNAFLLWTHE